jgi:hypothetical protein
MFSYVVLIENLIDRYRSYNYQRTDTALYYFKFLKNSFDGYSFVKKSLRFTHKSNLWPVKHLTNIEQ